MLSVSGSGHKKLLLSAQKFMPVNLSTEGCCTAKKAAQHIVPDSCCAAFATAESSSLLQTARLRWRITGMDCASCARKVENAVRQINGVKRVQVVFSTQKLLVDAGENLRESIEQSVQMAGYQLQDETQNITAVPANRLRDYGLIAGLALLMLAGWGLAQMNELAGNLVFMLTTFGGLWPVGRKAIRLLRTGNWFAIESLMTVATLGAVIIGATAEAAMVLLLFLIGEQLESWAARRARRGVSALMALTPDVAIRINDGEREQVSPAALQPGDVIEVAAGGRLPADGKLISPCASFDESMLTGESLPVEHRAGEQVAAGVTSVDRLVTFEVVSKPGENAIDRIVKLLEDAEERRAPIERFIDRFSRIYTPSVMVLALLVAVVMPLAGNGSWAEWIYKALTLLLIGCPCALVISTPAAITSGLATAARIGALVKGGAALEQLSDIQQLAFDKTGTLTLGEPQVCSVQTQGTLTEDEVLALAAAVEQGSRHPLAQAIVQYAEQRGLSLPVVCDQLTLAGAGIEALVAGEKVRLTAPDKLPASVLTTEWRQRIIALENQGQTVVTVIRNGRLSGLIALRDMLRPEAHEALAGLRRLKVSGVMLTGDNPRTAAMIAAELGLEFHAGLLPEDKVKQVRELNDNAPLAMVGDGINDAPAMKSAALGIAMGSGSDVALETADVALIQSRLTVLPALIALARATRRNVRQNIIIAIGLKVLFLLSTLSGLSSLWMAVLADTGATVLVTLNALRLLASSKSQR